MTRRKRIAHRISVASKPGRAPAPIVSRFECSCGMLGEWTTPELAHAQGDAHVELEDGVE